MSQMKPKYEGDKLFRFNWGKTIEEGYGRDVADAFTRLGYSAGAIRALVSYEEVK